MQRITHRSRSHAKGRRAWHPNIHTAMTTRRIVAAIMFLRGSVFAAHADDLTMATPVLVEIREVATKHIDNQTGHPFDAHWKDYTFQSLLKNVSDRPITVITQQLRASGRTSLKDAHITLEPYPPLLDGDSQVIPSASELRLVTINPGESAAIEFRYRAMRAIDSATVTYSPKDHFNGRFGFWTGTATSPPWKASENKGCKSK